MTSSLCSGTLTKWKDKEGFGFIRPKDGGKDVFLHISDIRDATRRPQVNDTIYYRRTIDATGKVRACDAFILGARHQRISSKTYRSDHSPTLTTVRRDAFPLVQVVILSVIPLIGIVHLSWIIHNPLPLVVYPAMSVVTFTLYADDKLKAKRGEWRIPEHTLHLCELAGGWPGGFAAQRVLRHKSQKPSYQIEFWIIVAIHYAAWLLWLWFAMSRWG